MNYYKKDNKVYEYNDLQIKQGLAKDKTAMTQEEVEAHLNPPVVVDKVAEAQAYLASTDYMMTADYDKDTTEVRALRQEARDIIRAGA